MGGTRNQKRPGWKPGIVVSPVALSVRLTNENLDFAVVVLVVSNSELTGRRNLQLKRHNTNNI